MSRERPQLTQTARLVAVAAVVVTAFLSAYSLASWRAQAPTSARSPAAPVSTALATTAQSRGASPARSRGASPAQSAQCSCCGGVPAQTATVGQAKAVGGVQHITVDTASGTWSPNEIHVNAGMPVEIRFRQGTGCLAQVTFDDFGITKDLTNGGAVVMLPALQPGEYGFACGMRMALGKVVVQ